MTRALPTAALWDMDGTLINSEPYWGEEIGAIVAEHGGTWTEADDEACLGSGMLRTAAIMKTRADIPMADDELVRHLEGRVAARVAADVPWVPGARELLLDLRAEGVPCALVTMAWRQLASVTVAALPPETFAVVLTGEDVPAPKPYPDPYLLGLEGLGVGPEGAVAFEDSPAGSTAALAAGLRTVGVPGEVPLEPRPGLVLRESLAGLRATDVLGLFDTPEGATTD